jgi:hypothetical protein
MSESNTTAYLDAHSDRHKLAVNDLNEGTLELKPKVRLVSN